jgi:DtxR family Mn-dependent transcriptional regulator
MGMTELTDTMKGYIKAIFSMEEEGNEVKTTNLAKAVNVKPASVTEMIQKLGLIGLVHHDPYHGITLTEKGKNIVTMIVRKHRLLE